MKNIFKKLSILAICSFIAFGSIYANEYDKVEESNIEDITFEFSYKNGEIIIIIFGKKYSFGKYSTPIQQNNFPGDPTNPISPGEDPNLPGDDPSYSCPPDVPKWLCETKNI